MARFERKTVIVTGAAQGMGEAHVRAFAAEGARVVMTDLQTEAGQKIADELGQNVRFVRHDVASADDWAAVVKEAESRFGRVDVLVNNAGIIGPLAMGADLSEADFRKIFEINELGVFLGMKAVVPGMKAGGGGAIVNISSIAGMTGLRASSNIAYVSTKFAVRGMTKYMAAVLGGDGIRVNSVHPGVIMTPMMVAALDGDGGDLAKAIPLGRMAQPEEVSKLVLFLASEESSYISGEEHVIDGALTAG